MQDAHRFKIQLDELELMVRQGKGDLVRKQLLKISVKKVPRLNLVQFANLARRVGLLQLAIQALHPVIRSEKLLELGSTPQERTEYSAALTETGAVGEAQALLVELEKETKEPKAALYFAFTYFRNWQYDLAIEKLNNYLKLVTDPYQKLVGQVNLAAAYTSTSQTASAMELIAELIIQAQEKNHVLLLGNLYELQAQVYIQKKNFSAALASLEASEKLLGGSGNISYLYAKKWRGIIEAKKSPNLHQAFMRILPIMEEARFRREWETLRDIDRQLGAIFQDEFLAAKLTFGTPFNDYRKIIKSEFISLQIPNDFYLTNRWQWQPQGRILEVDSGYLDGKNIGLKPGALLHRFLATLVTDFYRPFSTGSLFSKLFPEEFYNPFTAYDRIYQCAKRLRDTFENELLPIEIRQQNYEFSLKVTGPVSLHIHINQIENKNADSNFYRKLFKSLSEKGAEKNSFTAQDLARELKTSVRTANRIIKEHDLITIGGGKYKRYRPAA